MQKSQNLYFFLHFFPAYLQRMLKQVCLRAFQGTVYRSDRCAFRCNRSKSGLKKQDRKSELLWWKSYLLYLCKGIKLKECCHPNEILVPSPTPLFGRYFRKCYVKGVFLLPLHIEMVRSFLPCLFCRLYQCMSACYCLPALEKFLALRIQYIKY